MRSIVRSVSHSVLGLALAAASFSAGCGDDDAEPGEIGRFVTASMVFGAETVSYISRLENLGPQTVTFERSLEVSGIGDAWFYQGALYVTSSETLSITKYTVTDDALVPAGTVNFGVS